MNGIIAIVVPLNMYGSYLLKDVAVLVDGSVFELRDFGTIFSESSPLHFICGFVRTGSLLDADCIFRTQKERFHIPEPIKEMIVQKIREQTQTI